MIHKNKIIGIWGYGITGQAAARFFYQHNIPFAVMDKNEKVRDMIAQTFANVPFFHEDEFARFFSEVDIIVPSAGIDIKKNYASIKDKLHFELDLFFHHWQKPILGITGTVGKTSTTHFLSSVLSAYGMPITTGGNIGTSTFDLLNNASAQLAVLELSSFQLENTQHFVPDLALWTNFFPNHLDRHGSDKEYFVAKYQLLARQTHHQKALLPIALIPWLESMGWPPSQLFFFSSLCDQHVRKLSKKYPIFTLVDQHICLVTYDILTPLINITLLPDITFVENWLIIVGALHILGMPIEHLQDHAQQLNGIEHRLEKVATINGVTFYNDSKSTTVTSTKAAVHQLAGKSIILLLGGLSKGVDRSSLIQELAGSVKHIATFGKEAVELYNMCQQYHISASFHDTLETCIEHIKKIAAEGDIVLLSPAGSSFDLFTDYQERGKRFKSLVTVDP